MTWNEGSTEQYHNGVVYEWEEVLYSITTKQLFSLWELWGNLEFKGDEKRELKILFNYIFAWGFQSTDQQYSQM